MDFSPVKHEKPATLIINRIWDMIVTGELKPGDKLPPEKELVKSFGVSQVTLREALSTLEAYGHITKRRGASGGSIILDITPTKGIYLLGQYLDKSGVSFDEVKQLGMSIYPDVAYTLAQNLTPAKKKSILEKLDQMDNDLETMQNSVILQGFGIALAELSGNQLYKVVAELIRNRMLSFEKAAGIYNTPTFERKKLYYQGSYTQYKKVTDEILSEDPDRAKQAMIDGLYEIFKVIKQYLGI